MCLVIFGLSAFRPFLRELCCVAYRHMLPVIVNKPEYNQQYGQAEWRRPVSKVAHFENLLKIYRDAVLVKLWSLVL